MKNRIVTLAAAVGLAMAMAGCAGNCEISCERYQECVSADFDVEQCTDTCNTKSDDDEDFEAQAKECAQCVSDQEACSEAVNRCFDDCLSVVLAPP